MTRRGCLSADELVRATHNELTEELREHLDGCRTCARRVALVQRSKLAGVEPIDEAITEVDALVAQLLVTPRDEWWAKAREPEYQSADVVRRLIAVADDASVRDRKVAVALVATATRIVNALCGDPREIGDLRFETWKFASVILREAGKYTYTEAALKEAEHAAPAASDPELAEASIHFSRALLYAEPDVWRPDEASELLDRAERVFARKDVARQQAVRTARAFLLYRSGDFSSAHVEFASILEATPESARESYLQALTNLMWARVDLGEHDDEVLQAVALLIKEYSELGRITHAARARWLMGKVQRLRGELDESAELFRRAIREIGDSDSAIRAGLDLLETLLVNERHDEALPLARRLAAEAVALDRREPSRRRSLTAAVFAYARDAAQRGALTADLVSELARYIDRIRRQRPTDFIPPMPLHDM